MRQLPGGTITMLFTDIEGSTRLLQRLGEEYGKVLSESRRLLRAAFAHWNGHEVDTQGDAFFVAFARAADAIAAAVEAQRALFTASWPQGATVRVRMGIHTGEPQAIDEGYVGVDVHIASRIMSAAHGGQVLLSATTQALTRHDLPENVGVKHLGEYHLKDIEGSARLFQLTIPELPHDFPALKTAEHTLYTLPTQLTTFVGRIQESKTLAELLHRQEVRLLTLVGPAGVGKTRLATHSAGELAPFFPHGIAFVNLAQATDSHGVIGALAQTLSVREETPRPLFERVQEVLREKHLLLLLDNFEQAVSAAPVVTHLLASCPHLKALVTSRVALHVQAEYLFEVQPLELPVGAPHWRALAAYPALQLFLQRASAVAPDFRLTQENAAAIVDICERLDGIPLALELAAARMRHFTPAALLARLARPAPTALPLLTGGARDLPARQQTLRGAIAWSYDLLSPEEQQVFRRLAIFVNGCDLAAAEALLARDLAQPLSLPEILEALEDKSLLRQRPAEGGSSRLWLLQTLREYGQEQVEAAGEVEELQQRHAEYYLDWAERSAPYVMGADQVYWMDRLEQEYENLRAALNWLLTEAPAQPRAAEQALRLCAALGNFWEATGMYSEASASLHTALAHGANVDPAVRARVLQVAAMFALHMDDNTRAADLLRESQALFRDHADTIGMAHILRVQGILARTQQQYKVARRLLTEALDAYKGSGSLAEAASVREILAELLIVQGSYRQAQTLLAENLAFYATIHERYHGAYPLYHLARAQFLTRGDLVQAYELVKESLALFKTVRNKRLIAYARVLMAQILLVQEEDARVETLLEESEKTFQDAHDRYGLAETLLTMAQLAARQGVYAKAGNLYEQSWAILQELAVPEFSALCLESWGETLTALGDPARAVGMWAGAATLRAQVVAPMPPIYRATYERAVKEARQILGEEPFKRAWEEGRDAPTARPRIDFM